MCLVASASVGVASGEVLSRAHLSLADDVFCVVDEDVFCDAKV